MECPLVRKLSVFAFAAIGLVCSIGSSAQAAVQGYYRWPTIHGDQVVFTSEGDLWKVSTHGGIATRLTSHPAAETNAHFSPDGSKIAFTADYEGNSDVYVMSADGGEPKRMTFHPSREECVGWTPDGRYILARARRSGLDSESTLYRIPADGGDPEVVQIGVAEAAVYSPDSKMIAFNPFLWNGTWKRYRGGTAAKIWVGDLASGKFWKISSEAAVDQYPMWVDGRLYFVSERTFPANIWSCKPDGTDAKQITHHDDYDVRVADSDGNNVVYTVAADLWVLDTKSGKSSKLDVTLPSDRIRERAYVGDATRTIESFDLSDDGKRVAVSSRGEIWNAPAKPGGRIIQVTDNDSGIRQRQPAFSPDGKKIACITDETDEQELAIYDSAGKEKHKILTHGGKGWIFSPTWSPDSKHLAYADLTGTLYLVDAESGQSKALDQDKNWELTEYTFSPDSKWIAYTKQADNRTQKVWICELETGKCTTVSAGFTNDYSPTWDPKGKYLYFLSNRVFHPYLDELDRSFLVTKTAKPCIVVLAKDGKSPLLPEEVLDEGKDDKDKDKDADGSTSKPTTSKSSSTKASKHHHHTDSDDDEDADSDNDDSGGGGDKDSDKPVEVKIDVDGIVGRVVELPIKADNCGGLEAAEDKLFWITTPTKGMGEDGGGDDEDDPKPANGKLVVYDFKDRKLEVWLDDATDFILSRDGKHLAWSKDQEIKVVSTDSKPGDDIKEKVSISDMPLWINPQQEWKQIYADAWRLQRDFYWDPNMVGLDWPAMRKKYEPLLDRVASRGELNDVIGQLIGELGTSHTYVFGGDSTYQPPKSVPVGVLGADIELDKKTGLHRFVKILRAEPWETNLVSPLTSSYAHVSDGDYLLAVNGKELAATDNADARFINQAGVQVLLTVCSKADKSDARDIEVETLWNDEQLRYADWCRRNRQYVEARTSGKVGYFHLPDMSGAGLIKFIEDFYPQIYKDALIIDDRGNHGGFVSQMIIEKLNRKPWAYDRPRRGMGSTYPDRVHVGYKCVLINEHAGSDGDIFPDSFRTLGLGPLIGKRTWGGVIGIRTDKPFVDAGMSSQPEFAWWDAKRGWAIENHGVDPDIEVEYTPEDWIAGRDPQLERGIEEMLKAIHEKPIQRPTPPPFPIRTPQTASGDAKNAGADARGR